MMAQANIPSAYHVPVLADQTAAAMKLSPEDFAVDCTTGGGGHSAMILKQLGEGGTLLCLDKDQDALDEALPVLSELAQQRGVRLVGRKADFRDLQTVLEEEALGRPDLILADIGISSYQVDEAERGFSYMQDGPLDMRMDRTQGASAADLINTLETDELASIFREYGEERYSARIARRITERRTKAPFTRTLDLADTIRAALPAAARHEAQHPAKRSFQALRIAVNQELQALDDLLEAVPQAIAEGGRLLVISFHSLEDRRVKQTFRKWEDPCECPAALPCVCGQKPLGRAEGRSGYTAAPDELEANPRARSARLRVFAFSSPRVNAPNT